MEGGLGGKRAEDGRRTGGEGAEDGRRRGGGREEKGRRTGGEGGGGAYFRRKDRAPDNGGRLVEAACQLSGVGMEEGMSACRRWAAQGMMGAAGAAECEGACNSRRVRQTRTRKTDGGSPTGGAQHASTFCMIRIRYIDDKRMCELACRYGAPRPANEEGRMATVRALRNMQITECPELDLICKVRVPRRVMSRPALALLGSRKPRACVHGV